MTGADRDVDGAEQRVTDPAPTSGEELADRVDVERVRQLVEDRDRPHDALRVLRFVLEHPDGAPLTWIVDRCLGRTDTRRNEMFVRRLVDDHPRLFETARQQQVTVVRPAQPALHLITGGQISKPTDGDGTDETPAHSLLRDVDMLDEQGRQIVLDRFAEYVDRNEDRKIVMEDTDATGENYLVMDYRTRFTDDGRQGKMWATFQGAWENAAEEYDDAALMTLTTDPKMHDGLEDAWENISESWNRLMTMLSSDSRLGYRPDYIGVLEATESGLPHLHVVVFGEPWLIDQRELSNYWGRYQGEVVDIRRLRNRDGAWTNKGGGADRDVDAGDLVADGGDAGDGGDGGEDLDGKAYLGKYLSKLMDGLEQGGAELCGADAEEEPAWKLGMYWLTDRQMIRTSQDLKPEDDPGDVELPPAPGRWQFVGAWRRHDLPARILRNRAVRRRPPPDRGDPPPSD